MTQGSTDHIPPGGGREQDEVLAGEYVLGVLPVETRRRVEARMAVDPSFAQLVARWQADFASFDEDYRDERPPAAVFREIEQRLFEPGESAASGLWHMIGFWRGLSFGTSIIAVAALSYIGITQLSSQTDKGIVAELTRPDSPLALRASFDPASGRMRIVPVADQTREKSLQLWLVPDNGNPTSIGVFAPGTDGEILIPAELRTRIGEGAILAVSVEPLGGSPTGLPTGPVIASGMARSL